MDEKKDKNTDRFTSPMGIQIVRRDKDGNIQSTVTIGEGARDGTENKGN